MMDNDDLKMLWGAQPAAPAPDISALLRQAVIVKNKARNKVIWGNLLLVGTAAFIGFIWITCQPQMLTTKVGIVLVISAIAMYVIASTSALGFLFRSNPVADSASYLAQLIQLRHKQEFLHKTMMTLYFILLSTGMLLYLIEYTMMMSRRSGAIAYMLTFGWIAFAWFYIRPRTARKQLGPLNEVIKQLEEVNKQLND